MSMPTFPNTTFTRDQALNLPLASIAYKEFSLGHILNSEGGENTESRGDSAGSGCSRCLDPGLTGHRYERGGHAGGRTGDRDDFDGKMTTVLTTASEEPTPEPKPAPKPEPKQESVNIGA